MEMVLKTDEFFKLHGLQILKLKGHAVIRDIEYIEDMKEIIKQVKESNVEFYFREPFYESGGGCTNTGQVRIVCGPNGEPLRPAILFTRGHLANRDHALFFLNQGQSLVTIDVARHRAKMHIIIRLHSLVPTKDLPKLETKIITETEIDTHCSEEKLKEIIPNNFINAVIASIEKSWSYHCRNAYYYKK